MGFGAELILAIAHWRRNVRMAGARLHNYAVATLSSQALHLAVTGQTYAEPLNPRATHGAGMQSNFEYQHEISDPRDTLRQVLSLAKNGLLPRDAALWASAELKNANAIFYRMKALTNQGRPAPTPVHRASLIDIETTALKWIATTGRGTGN